MVNSSYSWGSSGTESKNGTLHDNIKISLEVEEQCGDSEFCKRVAHGHANTWEARNNMNVENEGVTHKANEEIRVKRVDIEGKLKIDKQNFEYQDRENKRSLPYRMQNDLEVKKYAIKQQWHFFKNPKTIGLYTVSAAVIVWIFFAAKNGFPIVKRWIEQKLFKPVLIMETSDDAKSRAKMKEFTLNNIILPKTAKDEFIDLVKATHSAIEVGIPFQHTIFYGPPGTGKTLAAKTIANLSGMDYDIIAGSSFDQFSEENALQELQHILTWARKARKGKKGRIIFIDEADSLLKKRDGSDMRGTKLVNMFLSYVPEPQDPDLMFIFATNHPERLDPAILSRISHHFEFQLPDEENRKAMLALQLGKLGKEIKIAPDVMKALAEMAEMMDGFSGRDILSFAVQCRSAAIRRKDKMITKAVADRILERLIKSKKAEAKMQKGTLGYFKSDEYSQTAPAA